MTAPALCEAEPTPLAESLRRLETLVSPFTGVIRAVEPTLATTDDAPLVALNAALADTRALIGAEIDAQAIAWSHLPGRSRAAALGEAVERYSAAFVPDGKLILASASELGNEAVAPERFALFHETQYAKPAFPARAFTPQTRVCWVRGFEIGTGKPVRLPAQLVYLAEHRVPGEELIGYSTSNGLACRPTLAEAILSGLLEVVERDAFALTWYSGLELPRVEIDSHEALERFWRRYVAPTGLRCSVVDLSIFHRIPTLLAVVQGNRRDIVALTVGAASAPTAEEAWTRAVGEAFGSRAWARHLRLSQPGRCFDESFADIVDFDDHVHLHAVTRYGRRAAFLCASPARRAIDEIRDLEGSSVTERIEAIVGRLASEGIGAYAVDVTAPDVRAAGLVVVKVVAPELCQLDVIHSARFLGGPRLCNFASKLGLRQSPLGWHELNPTPHPFP
jgi:ribosomal protein S12 methylthiotransferase accessory factor